MKALVFRSEPVEDESYLFTVLKYIHPNPLKVGLVKRINEYRWSSYNEHIGKSSICNTDFIFY